MEFQERMKSKKAYLACEHIYYVFLMILRQDVNNSMHIHQAKIFENALEDMLTKAIKVVHAPAP